jgi:hypothetical protein
MPIVIKGNLSLGLLKLEIAPITLVVDQMMSPFGRYKLKMEELDVDYTLNAFVKVRNRSRSEKDCLFLVFVLL